MMFLIYYYYKAMLIYNDQRVIDLPLQLKSHPYNDKDNRLEERPKQISGHPYRLESVGKENRIKVSKENVYQSGRKIEKEQVFKSPNMQNEQVYSGGDKKRSRNQNLRNIIKKQLFSNQKQRTKKKLFVGSKNVVENNQKENRQMNRYQQLLCEVYGQPKPIKTESNRKPKDSNQRFTSKQRSDSVRTLNIQRENYSLQRYRSATNIKEKTIDLPTYGKSQKMKGSPTYLELFMQKRKCVLFL